MNNHAMRAIYKTPHIAKTHLLRIEQDLRKDLLRVCTNSTLILRARRPQYDSMKILKVRKLIHTSYMHRYCEQYLRTYSLALEDTVWADHVTLPKLGHILFHNRTCSDRLPYIAAIMPHIQRTVFTSPQGESREPVSRKLFAMSSNSVGREQHNQYSSSPSAETEQHRGVIRGRMMLSPSPVRGIEDNQASPSPKSLSTPSRSLGCV
jgi:hypothetical protein